MTILKLKQGQTLVEVLVAVGVTTLLLVAMVAAVTRSLSNAQFSKNKSQAAKYVEEGLEVIRSIRDNSVNWQAFSTSYPEGVYKLNSQLALTANCTQADKISVSSIFSRCVDISDDGAEKKIIKVTVYWTDGSGAHSTYASTYLTSWK